MCKNCIHNKSCDFPECVNPKAFGLPKEEKRICKQCKIGFIPETNDQELCFFCRNKILD